VAPRIGAALLLQDLTPVRLSDLYRDPVVGAWRLAASTGMRRSEILGLTRARLCPRAGGQQVEMQED